MDWNLLKLLRKKFLGLEQGRDQTYWTHELLDAYDQTFAQRIGWKWNSVLSEIRKRGWTPPPGYRLIDWGAGTGIATRKFLDCFPHPESVVLIDSSQLAVHFAKSAILREFALIQLNETYGELSPEKDVLIISHVVNELSEREIRELIVLCNSVHSVIWIEPGTPHSSELIIRAREQLRLSKKVIAPCFHSERCGLLAISGTKDWCHHFCEVPTFVFQSSFWKKFSETLEIDLRSLPVSYLAVTRSVTESTSEDEILVIGRPRLYKGDAKVLGCSREGVKEHHLLKKKNPELFKALESNALAHRISANRKDS